jgi:predicted dienelactone hydrolase
MRPSWTPALISLALACSSPPEPEPEPTAAQLQAEAAQPGPWRALGSGTFSTTWSVDGLIDERTNEVAIWYPSAQAEGAVQVVDGAPVAEGTFPVVVFSHGHQAFAAAASTLMIHLASHGHLVIAPEHTGNTLLDGADRTTEIYFERPLDVSAALDALERHPLFGRTVNRLPGALLIGHSFGGYTALADAGAAYDLEALLPACDAGTGNASFCSTLDAAAEAAFAEGFYEPRLKAIVPMAPGDFDLFGASGLAATEVPALVMGGGLDDGGDKQEFWDALAFGDNRYLRLPRAGHNSFTDFPALLEDDPDLLPAEEGWEILNIYLVAWADRWIGQDRFAPLLDSEHQVSPEAEWSWP